MESIHTCHSEPVRTLAWESPDKKEIAPKGIPFGSTPGTALLAMTKGGYFDDRL